MRARIEQRGVEPGDGPPLVLLPGAAADPRLWEPIVERLAPRRALHLVSIAGFSGMPEAPGPLFPGLLDELAERVAELDAPVLVGHSFGAFLAWRLMLRCPGVRGVVAVDGLPAVGASLQGPSADDSAARLARAEDLVAALKPSLQAMLFEPRHLPRVLEVARGTSPRVLAEAMHRIWTTDLGDALAADPRPTLLVLPGDEHLPASARAAKQDLARAQVGRLPSHRVVVLARAGHYLLLDRPDALARELLAFAVG